MKDKIKRLLTLIILTLAITGLIPLSHAFAAPDTKSSKLNICVYVGRTADLEEYIYYNPSLEKYHYWEAVYASADTKIASVDKNGLIKGIAEGKTQITVTFQSYEWSAKKNDYLLVKAKKTVYVEVEPNDGSTSRDYLSYWIDDGKVTITGMLKQLTNIVIPEQINGYPVKEIASYAFSDNMKLKSITLSENIEIIGNGAFSNCDSLKKVIISSTIKEIGISAFSDCAVLESINLPDKLVKISTGLFCGCSKLKSISIGNNTKSIEDCAFKTCTSLEIVEFGESIQTIGSEAFYGCRSLKKIKLPDSTQVIGNLSFYDCSSLEELILTNHIRQIGDYSFTGCNLLTEVKVSDGKADSTDGAKILPDDYAIGVGAFWSCKALTSVEIPDSIRVIGSRAFYSCLKLENLVLPNSLVKIDDWAFYSCEALKNFALPEKVETIEEYAFCCCPQITELVIPDSVKKIGDYAFNSCNNLIKITVNNDIERNIGEGILSSIGLDTVEKFYANNVTFQLTEEDWKEINLLLGIIQEMGVQETDSDTEKIRKVHDWLVINTSYSYKQYLANTEELSTVYIVLEKHFAVCSAYSEVFERFMDLLNIECITIVSTAMDHSWNMVKLDDGCWYHVDVTWDDPGSNDEIWEAGWLSYSNLLRDDEGIKETGHHDWQEDAPTADGTEYLNCFDINFCIKF